MDSKSSPGRLSRLEQAQSGQAIILMALAMIALIGMLGLSIDGGGMFFLQRDAQNATDAAVLAATYALCAGGNQAAVENAGYEAAAANGFRNEGDRSVSVSNPPLHGEKSVDSGAPDRFNYVEVSITANKPAYFIQVVYQGPLQVTTHAVGSCTPPFDASKVGAIFAISNVKECTNTVQTSGSTQYIEGGIFSNNEIAFTGSSTTIVGGVEAVSDVKADPAGKIDYSVAPVFPSEERPDPFASIYLFNDFTPTGRVVLAAQDLDAKQADFTFKYTTVLSDDPAIKGKGTWTPTGALEGMYYVEGNVDLDKVTSIGLEGVTIAATGMISGSKIAQLHYYAYPGASGIMLISNVQAPADCKGAGSNGIKVSGNSTTWHGVIYAPHSGAEVSGSGLVLYGAIIAQTVNTSGSDLRLVADPSIIPPRPAIVQIAE